jgi:hypothetical protein
VLSCDEDTGVEWFAHALAVAERAGYTDLMMVARRDRGWDWEGEFGAVRVRLANGPGTLAAHDYATYGELVHAVSQAARVGQVTLDVRAHH